LVCRCLHKRKATFYVYIICSLTEALAIRTISTRCSSRAGFSRDIPLQIVNGICCALTKEAGRSDGTCIHQVTYWSVHPSNINLHQGSQQTVIECGQFKKMHDGIPDTEARLKTKVRTLSNPISYMDHKTI